MHTSAPDIWPCAPRAFPDPLPPLRRRCRRSTTTLTMRVSLTQSSRPDRGEQRPVFRHGSAWESSSVSTTIGGRGAKNSVPVLVMKSIPKHSTVLSLAIWFGVPPLALPSSYRLTFSAAPSTTGRRTIVKIEDCHWAGNISTDLLPVTHLALSPQANILPSFKGLSGL